MKLIIDFLGFQYAAIAANCCQVCGLIIGTFASWRLKKPLLIIYILWSVLWVVWSSYLICLYLEVGSLNLNSHSWTVNLIDGTGSTTWFKSNPFACARFANYSDTNHSATNQISTKSFCWSDFRYLEVYNSSFQIFLSILGLLLSLGTINEIEKEHDTTSVLSMKYVNSLERSRKDKMIEVPFEVSYEEPLVHRFHQ